MATKIKKIKPEITIVIGKDEVPLPSQYGAAELKVYIRRNTIKGTIVTLLIMLILLIINFVVDTVQNIEKVQFVAPINKISLEDLPPPATDAADLAPPPDVIINSGPAARAGNPIPVPDAMIAPDVKDFATMEIMDKTSSEGGDGTDLSN